MFFILISLVPLFVAVRKAQLAVLRSGRRLSGLGDTFRAAAKFNQMRRMRTGRRLPTERPVYTADEIYTQSVLAMAGPWAVAQRVPEELPGSCGLYTNGLYSYGLCTNGLYTPPQGEELPGSVPKFESPRQESDDAEVKISIAMLVMTLHLLSIANMPL